MPGDVSPALPPRGDIAAAERAVAEKLDRLPLASTYWSVSYVAEIVVEALIAGGFMDLAILAEPDAKGYHRMIRATSGRSGATMPVGLVKPCRVYWGSHGCRLERGHDGTCVCCCTCVDHASDADDEGCAGAAPYYGPDTGFYGEDAAARGLPLLAEIHS